MDPHISVVINTLNEEKNLPYAIRSVKPWVDEIIVVDMYSEDRTVEIAKAFDARVFYHTRLGYADPARAYAVSQASGEWILMLDADEITPLSLSQKLREISRTNVADVVIIRRLNFMFGQPLQHTGWGPYQDKHPRFFKAGFVQLDDEIHNFLKPIPKARLLELPYIPGQTIVHFNYLDIAQFIEKMNRYTSIEARQVFEQGEQVAPFQGLVRAARGFFRRYVKLSGYRDGWRGFYLSLFWAFYRLVVFAKLTEIREVGPREATIAHYQAEAERILTEYHNAENS
jgi:glycosyltransferase involved in cell wall biosynthesis